MSFATCVVCCIMMLAWICGRGAQRSAQNHRTYPKELLWSRAIQDSLRQGFLAGPQLPQNASEWEYHLRNLHQKGICLALLRAGISLNTLTVLSDEERLQMEYYMFTNYSDHSFGFLEVVDVCVLAWPDTCFYSAGQRGAKSIWSTCSMTTFERFNTLGPMGGGTFGAAVQQWADRYDLQLDPYIRDGAFFVDLVLSIPIPHAILVSAKQWSSYAVPMKDKNGHSIKFLEKVRPLVEAIGEVGNNDDSEILQGPLGPNEFHAVADAMRQLLTFVPQHNVLLRSESIHFIKRTPQIH